MKQPPKTRIIAVSLAIAFLIDINLVGQETRPNGQESMLSAKETPISQDLVYRIHTQDAKLAGTIILHQGSLLASYCKGALVAPQSVKLNSDDTFNKSIDELVGRELGNNRALLAPAAIGETRIFPAGDLISSQMILYIIDAIAPPGFKDNEPYPERIGYMRSLYSALIGLISFVNAQFTNHQDLYLAPPHLIDQKRAWEKNIRLVIDQQSDFTMQKRLEQLYEKAKLQDQAPLKIAIEQSHDPAATIAEADQLHTMLQKALSDEQELILFPINSIGMPVLGGGNLNYPIEESAPIAAATLIECMQLYAERLTMIQQQFPEQPELQMLKPLTITIYFYASWNPTPARAMPVMQKALDSNSAAKRIQ